MIDAAKPLMIVLTCFYGCGSKSFEQIRPEPINAPMQGFHNEVNVAMSFGGRILMAMKHEALASDKAIQIPARMLTAVNREFKTFNGQR
jgi:hypothetical protein